MRHVVIISLILALSPSISMLLMRTFKMADVTISEVRLKTLMKEMFKEKFEKQQNQKSGAYRDSARSKSCESREVEKLEEQINELQDYQVDPERLKFTKRKIVELEDRSRRNNLPHRWDN